LNTPSHHRVHHGVNPQYVDRNYAGVLIVWDRLFGTFEPESVAPVYGLVKPLGSFNPLWANLHRWVEIASMSRRTSRTVDKIYAWLAPPEWRPADLGGPVVVPEPDRDGPSLIARPDRARDRRVALAFVVVLAASSWFIHAAASKPAAPLVIVVGVAVLLAIVSFGWIYSPARAR
ncbi:MAG TPA: sterol desaturase family protein, partial [Polyangia bacterium]|nr:sterol desaturase family protein [Polyangia bacterium]